MNYNWKTSVTELLVIFRGALLAIIPWLEKAKIKWTDEEAYDDWDNIAESLFQNIVCSSLIGEVTSDYQTIKYNFDYDDYSSINFIGVRFKNNSDKIFAFVAFQSKLSPMDSVKVAELDGLNKVIDYAKLDIDSLDFVYVKNFNHKKEIIDYIEVTL